MKSQHIPVFLSSDNAYAPFVATTIVSIMEHTQSNIDCFVLDGGISDKNKDKIKSLEQQFHNLNIEFIVIDLKKYFKSFPDLHYFSLNMYSRFLIPQIKPKLKKIIYSDVDVIFKDDIKKYWDVDLKGYGLAAPIEECGELFSVTASLNHERRKFVFNIPQEHLYFQSGNLIIDCDYWRKNNIFQKLCNTVAKYKNKLECPDLDALNIVFANNYKALPYRFSVCTHMVLENQKHPEIVSEINQAIVIHYASAQKPWKYKNIPYASLFWEVVNKTSFATEIKKRYWIYKLSLHSEKNENLKKSKILNIPWLIKNKKSHKIYIFGICINPKFNLKKKIVKLITLPIFLKKFRKRVQKTIMDISLNGFISFFSFAFSKVRKNTVLVVEPNACHGEVVPGLVKYLRDIGYNVDVLLRSEVWDEKPFSKIKLGQKKFVSTALFLKMMLKLPKIKKYEFVVMNSSRYFFTDDYSIVKSFEQVFGFWPQGKHKTLVVEHDQNNIALFHTEDMAKNNQLLTLGNFANGAMVNSHYFGDFFLKSKNKNTTFVVVGGINPEQKNHQLLLSAMEKLADKKLPFKVIVVGNGKLKGISDKVLPYLEVKGRLNFPQMYEVIANADFLLTLLAPDNIEHERYITTGVTGSAQLVYGFAKIPLIDKKFASFYGFDSKNAIVYNNDLSKAMIEAVEMSKIEYKKRQQNLDVLAKEIEKQSDENLKRIIK